MTTDTTERDLGRVEGKLDVVVASLARLEQKWDERADAVDKRFAANEKRITALETRFKVALVAAVASFLASLGDAKHVALALLHMAF